jgi:hypothetical protein
MCPYVRPIFTVLTALVCLVVTNTAFAWVETAVVTDAITLQLEPSGQATVAHELVMRVRGGPLKGTELTGIDLDAEPLDDATVSPVGGGSGESKPLLLSRGDDDTLRIEIGGDSGLRNGTYNFSFRYRTQLRQKSRIELRGSWAQIDWIGPRYPAGLDVAKVTFRLPYAPIAPRLPEVDPSGDELATGQLPSAAMLSQLRRNGTLDELELTRPHVAKGEPVLWRVWVSPATFPWLQAQASSTELPQAQPFGEPRSAMSKVLPLGFAALFACIVSLLVFAKSRAVAAECERQQLAPLPLVRLPAIGRAAGCGLGGALALLLAIRFELPTVASVTLVLSLLLSVYCRPLSSHKLRGPGRWLPIHEDEAWQKARTATYGLWLDASTSRGKLTLFGVGLVTLAIVFYGFVRQPYYSLWVIIVSVAVLPTLLTGCFSELPWARSDKARLALKPLARKLAKRTAFKVKVFARFADEMTEPDELRIRVSSSSMMDGLLGLEIASNCEHSHARPDLSLLIRLREGSPAYEAYGCVFNFGRGRTATERVAVVRYAVASSFRLCRLLDALLSPSPAKRAPFFQVPSLSKRSAKSRSSGSVTSKPSRGGAPSQATFAA